MSSYETTPYSFPHHLSHSITILHDHNAWNFRLAHLAELGPPRFNTVGRLRMRSPRITGAVKRAVKTICLSEKALLNKQPYYDTNIARRAFTKTSQRIAVTDGVHQRNQKQMRSAYVLCVSLDQRGKVPKW